MHDDQSAISSRGSNADRRAEYWDRYIRRTYRRVRKLSLPPVPMETDRYAVIIEPRAHPHLEYVCRNVVHFLGPEWGLIVLCSPENLRSVSENVLPLGGVYLIQLQQNLTREVFRALRKSTFLWEELLRGDQLLCFETDSLLRRRGIDDFLDYDYVGAPWSEEYRVSDRVVVGNGGLSLRRRSVMIDICRSAHDSVIPSEDAFFSIHLALNRDRYRIADPEVASSFSVETIYHPDPLGVHKPWEYLEDEQMIDLLESITYEE